MGIAQISSAIAFCSSQIEQARSSAIASHWNTYAQLSARLMFVLICVAETSSFVATITRNLLFFAIEESLWGVAYLITWPAYLHLFISARGAQRAQGCCV